MQPDQCRPEKTEDFFHPAHMPVDLIFIQEDCASVCVHADEYMQMKCAGEFTTNTAPKYIAVHIK